MNSPMKGLRATTGSRRALTSGEELVDGVDGEPEWDALRAGPNAGEPKRWLPVATALVGGRAVNAFGVKAGVGSPPKAMRECFATLGSADRKPYMLRNDLRDFSFVLGVRAVVFRLTALRKPLSAGALTRTGGGTFFLRRERGLPLSRRGTGSEVEDSSEEVSE